MLVSKVIIILIYKHILTNASLASIAFPANTIAWSDPGGQMCRTAERRPMQLCIIILSMDITRNHINRIYIAHVF